MQGGLEDGLGAGPTLILLRKTFPQVFIVINKVVDDSEINI